MNATLHSAVRLPTVAMLLLLTLMGCAEEVGEIAPLDGYPSGPYGGRVGDTIENLTLFDLDGEAFAFNRFHQADGQVLVLYITATWCFTCGPEVEWLNTQAASEDLAMLPVAVVVEDENYNAAGAEAGSVFEQTYAPTFLTLTDPDGVLTGYRDANAIPLNLVIQTDTMTITHRAQGFDETSLRQAIEEAVR